MLGVSQAFQDAVRGSHTRFFQLNVIQDSKVVAELPGVFDGSVTADATAAQLRRFSASIADESGKYTPEDMHSLLAPFGTQVQPMMGVLVPNVTLINDLDDNARTWAEGEHNGTIVDPDTGELILGFQD